MTQDDTKSQLLEVLKKEAFSKEKIKLSSGKESDYYIDARRVTLSAKGSYLCAQVIFDLIKDQRIDAIGGPTLGADPLVGAVALLSFQKGKPLNTFIIRKTPKAHGKQQQLEGPPLTEGSRVILIDDVATTGKAILQSMTVLREMKINIVQAICLVDRDEGAKDAIAQAGCSLTSIFTASDFLD